MKLTQYNPLKIWLFTSVHVICVSINPQVHPQETARPEFKVESEIEFSTSECLRLLNESVIDFYFPDSLDRKYGGYLQDLSSTESGEREFSVNRKFLTFQARQLWFFSHMAAHGIRTEEMKEAAGIGYTFIINNFLDTEHGGYYSMVTKDGFPTDPGKHAYLNAFVLYSLVEYYRASSDSGALNHAMDLFNILEEKARDKRHGGYNEMFSSTWNLITDQSAGSYVGPVGTKTYNTHLHLLEAFTSLYQETGDPLVGARLAELIHINTTTVKHPDFPANIDGWYPDWTVVESDRNFRASYGHDIECAWLVLDAARALGWPDSLLRNWADSTCLYSLEFGFDSENGGFFNGGPFGEMADDHKKVWWIQAEGLVAMATLHQLTGNIRYKQALESTYQLVAANTISPEGGWFASTQADGSPLDKTTTSMWQSAYHAGRALLRLSQIIEQKHQ